jgi:hypothetical protein
MKRETLVIRPEKHKRRIGILPTYAQRDRTKYTRKVKHAARGNHQDASAGAFLSISRSILVQPIISDLTENDHEVSDICTHGTEGTFAGLSSQRRGFDPRWVYQIPKFTR